MPTKSYPVCLPISPRTRRRCSAITLIEVIIALFILLMMSLMVAAVLPVTTRLTRSSNTYSQALAICQRKIDQLQEAEWGKLDYTSLFAYGIIDSTAATVNGSVTTFTFTNNNGTNTTAKSFDNLNQFFPGTGANAPTGTIRIEPMDDNAGSVIISGTSQLVMKKITVTVSWSEPVGPRQSFSMTALISQVSMD